MQLLVFVVSVECLMHSVNSLTWQPWAHPLPLALHPDTLKQTLDVVFSCVV